MVGQLRDEAANPGGMQRDGDSVGRNVDPLDQQSHDACLLGRVELVPNRLERAQGLNDIALLELGVLSCAVLLIERGLRHIVFMRDNCEPLARKSCWEGSDGIMAVILYKPFRIIE